MGGLPSRKEDHACHSEEWQAVLYVPDKKKKCEIRLNIDSQVLNAMLRYLDMLQKFWGQSRVVSQSSVLGGLNGYQFVECLEVGPEKI